MEKKLVLELPDGMPIHPAETNYNLAAVVAGAQCEMPLAGVLRVKAEQLQFTAEDI